MLFLIVNCTLNVLDASNNSIPTFIRTPDGKILSSLPAIKPTINELAQICALCNDARILCEEVITIAFRFL